MRAICWCKLTKLMVCFLPLKFFSFFLSFFLFFVGFYDFLTLLTLFWPVFSTYLLLIPLWIALSVSLLCECFWFTMFALTLDSFCNAFIIYDLVVYLFCSVISVVFFSLLFLKVCISLTVCEPLQCTNQPLWQEEKQLQWKSECFRLFVGFYF